MKKVIIILSVTLFFFSANAQKDSTAKDTVIILTIQQLNELNQDIQIQMSGRADVKKEQWLNDLNMLYKAVRIIPKEQQHTTK